MSIYSITFSPTGGTKRVADIIARNFSDEFTSIDLTCQKTDFEAISFTAEDICIVAAPAFGGRVPDVAVARLSQMQGNQAKAILVAVYGNRAYEDTLLELKNTMIASNFICVAGIAAIAEHSIMRQFAEGRPDENDKTELAAFAEQIKEKLNDTEKFHDLHVPGEMPYKEFKGTPMKPETTKDCIKCGLCKDKCPVGAIYMDGTAKTDSEACITCMACVAVCPKKARKVSKLVLTAASTKMKKACSGYKKNELFL
ncbi:MAG: EFR1 family ferrodoxin [Ruminococcus sp.]|nr:EFR1 family ferrodoxin [Ruminococcus sp.]